MKKFIELTFVVGTIFLLLYFFLYMFYFDSMCKNFKKETNGEYLLTISQMGDCKSSLVCEINNVETNKQNMITNWECHKKINNYIDEKTYSTFFYNIYNIFLKKFSKDE